MEAIGTVWGLRFGISGLGLEDSRLLQVVQAGFHKSFIGHHQVSEGFL